MLICFFIHNCLILSQILLLLINDSKILNDKFVEVYYKLVEQDMIIPRNNDGDKSLEHFAKKLGIHVNDIGLYLSGRLYINADIAFKICEEYGLNKEYFFSDITNIFDLSNPKAGNIIFVEDVEFFCGSGSFQSQSKNFKRFNDPTVHGEYYAFRASGNSMEKTISSGDVVYSRKLEKPNYLKEGDICAIATKNKAMIKRLKKKVYDKNENLISIILISDNNDEWPDEKPIACKTIQHTFRVEEIRNKNLQIK